MGWDSDPRWKSRSDVVTDQIDPGRWGEGTRSLAHKIVCDGVWIEWELAEGDRFIEFILIEWDFADGYSVKAMDEGTGPYYYDCPLNFLDLAPEANSKWRA